MTGSLQEERRPPETSGDGPTPSVTCRQPGTLEEMQKALPLRAQGASPAPTPIWSRPGENGALWALGPQQHWCVPGPSAWPVPDILGPAALSGGTFPNHGVCSCRLPVMSWGQGHSDGGGPALDLRTAGVLTVPRPGAAHVGHWERMHSSCAPRTAPSLRSSASPHAEPPTPSPPTARPSPRTPANPGPLLPAAVAPSPGKVKV